MPREQMESSVEGLKPGWSEILPQIGGVLKSMGFDPVLTSAARTREHQMRINPSAPNSYHVIQGGGGDAIIDSRARATGFGLLQIDGQAPSAKTGDDSQTQPSQTRQDFDLNTQGGVTQKLLEKFVNERFSKAVKEKDINAVNFFEPMLDDKDKFQNTTENREAVISRYEEQSVTPKTEREQKQKVGNAIIQLANQNGSSQKIQEWQIHFDRRPKHRGVSCSG